MLRTIINMFKISELRNRLLFTIGCLAVYRIGAYIPTPGIDTSQLYKVFGNSEGGLLGMMDLFTGGSMRNVTVMALGIMPYISASIIMQLMQSVVPSLEKLTHEGEAGRQKINQYTRYGTIVVCIIQAFMLSKSLLSSGVNLIPAPWFNIFVVITLTAGTIFLMWLGEQIQARGIGNGISIIIMASIVSRMPLAARQLWALYGFGASESRPMWQAVLLIVMFVAVVAGVILVIQGQRRIPVQYAKRVASGGRMLQGQSTYIPLRVNQAGVIPIIFASSILMVPSALARFVPDSWVFLKDTLSLFNGSSWLYLLCYAGMIVFFCFFYTAITFNPSQIAEDFKKGGAFVPGVRPGKPTADFLEQTMVRITVAGSVFLAVIAVTPMIIAGRLQIPFMITSFLGGTGLLIIVGVMLDTMQQVEAHLLMRHYDGFMKKGKLRGRY